MRGRSFFGLVVVAAVGLTCGGRKSGLGESCARTDDCDGALRCVAFACVVVGGGGGGSGGNVGGSGGSGGNVGGSGGNVGGSGGNVGGSGGNVGGSGGTGGGVGPGLSLGPCDDCVDQACAAELEACDGECVAIEACIETVCHNLSQIGAPDEGQCQVYCQNLHSPGKANHLAAVNCAVNEWSSCPCAGFPADADACRNAMLTGPCAQNKAACDANVDCTIYRDCVGTCPTSADCVACSATPEGQAGRAILEALELCIGAECLLENWSL